MEYDLDPIINLMNECFLDESSFNQFVIGSFLSAKNQLQGSLSEQLSQLVLYAHTNRKIPELLAKLEEKYPGVYQEYVSKFKISDTSVPPVETPKQNSAPPAPQSESKQEDNRSSELGIWALFKNRLFWVTNAAQIKPSLDFAYRTSGL